MATGDAPLPHAAIHILLAIGPGELHGYGILSEVAAQSGGQVRLAVGTLYTNLKRLVGQGLIEESDDRPDPELDDERRRYYRLTVAGHRIIAGEVARMEAQVARARPWVREVRP